ncbi:unnamed protein product [Rangifer tarandus platyrhynchus]|uniref:Uncharacterized protein n=1 Tax=Rangifer tarandus platyrhynchus TaxID=3082113 RepID=A0ABN9A513_RANTA|nr:unnamed protein product [Rangifer tarandus platyrhynchus]
MLCDISPSLSDFDSRIPEQPSLTRPWSCLGCLQPPSPNTPGIPAHVLSPGKPSSPRPSTEILEKSHAPWIDTQEEKRKNGKHSGASNSIRSAPLSKVSCLKKSAQKKLLPRRSCCK